MIGRDFGSRTNCFISFRTICRNRTQENERRAGAGTSLARVM
jgi:hypothetical protein